MHTEADRNKAIYHGLHDHIIAKRFQSNSSIRRHVHRAQYELFLQLVPAGSTVVDAGCGEGVLSVLLAKHGCTVVGIDLSAPNIEAAKAFAVAEGVADRVTFLVGDAEHLPVADNSADYAVSSHVLEHLPDFVQGARELKRVATKGVVAAIPTCLNGCSLALLGGDKFWTISRKTLWGVPLGMLRVALALARGDQGVNESYADHAELIHIYRFPWVGKRLLTQAGLKVQAHYASSLALPYIPWLLPLTTWLEHFRGAPVLRAMGYGTTYACRAG